MRLTVKDRKIETIKLSLEETSHEVMLVASDTSGYSRILLSFYNDGGVRRLYGDQREPIGNFKFDDKNRLIIDN